MIIDCHAHLEPRMLDVAAMIAKMDRCGVDKIALIPTMNDPLPETPKALLGVIRALLDSPLHPCARALNWSLMTRTGDLKLRGTIYRIYATPDNQTVADVLAAYPERFLGWVFLNPRVMTDPVEELERRRQIPGFIGVKLHPHWHDYAIEDALPIAARCAELQLPILIHLGFGKRGRWQLLTRRYPKLRLIFAHAGIPHFRRMWRDVADNPNLYVDVSSPYLSERLVRRAIAVVGPHRALFGTDAPYGFHDADHSYDYAHIKGWVERLPLRSGEIDRVLGDNTARLLGEAR
jgi:predicted TIM-barrel fold metal-dependent hydrolase